MPKRYLKIFGPEAEEHLASLRSGLLVLERNPTRSTLLHELLRSAHTLKGSALMVGLYDIATITDKVEEQLKEMVKGSRPVDTAAVDLLLKGVDAIALITTALSSGEEPQLDVTLFLEQYGREQAGESLRRPAASPSGGQLSETARATFRTLDALENLIGEISVKKKRLESRLIRVEELTRAVDSGPEAIMGGFQRELEDDVLYLDFLIRELYEKVGTGSVSA